MANKKKPKQQVEYRALSEIKPLDNNPRYIKTDDFERLCASVQNNADYSECRPIILSDRTGELVIIAGNQRYKAAQEVGLKEVPTILLHGLTEAKEKEIVIRDNVHNGKWDYDIWASGPWGAGEELSDWGVEGVDFLSDTNDESDIDSVFEEANNTEEKHKNIHITVEIPEELTEQRGEITDIIKEALVEYEGIKIK